MAGGWECLASHEGGTVVALATALTDDGTTLFAATATGLFASINGGRTWLPGGDVPLPLLTVVAPSARFAENHLLIAGTQTGCYRSTDAGQTWRQTLSGGRIFAIAIMSGAGQQESVFIGTQQDGILRSDDGGQTWAGANPGLMDLTVLALAFSPDAARDHTGFAATTSGLYRTRNGGKSWREVALPLDEPAVQCLAISPAFVRDRLVFAGTERDGLWRSDDGGTTWEAVPSLPDGGIGAIAFSSRDAETNLVAVATDGGVALSRDGGATWRLTGQTLPPVLDLAFVPDGNGETLVAALYRDGVARLAITEQDDRWIPATAGLRATFLTTLVASPTFAHDRTLFVSGPEAGLRVSRDGGHTWTDAGAGLDDALVYGVAITPHADGNHRVFVATDAGVYRSRDDGRTWIAPTSGSEQPTGMVVAGIPAGNGETPVFAATLDGHLIVSGDGGERWRPLHTPFDGATIVALACAPGDRRDQTLYVGTTQPAPTTGRVAMIVWRSTDGGGNWTRWLEESGEGGILPLAASVGQGGQDDDALFVGLGGRVMRPRPHAWQTRGDAHSPLWHGPTLATEQGGPVSITALAVSPTEDTKGIVFAATSAGMYRSRDRGRTFDRWSEGLLPAPILALAVTVVDDSLLVFALDIDGTIWRRTGTRS
ncbi:MAG: YCF48-related protein [Chloroflexota bacterium]|nr:YCF48-related protein [Chloroflexota bacterium]